jgi:zeaxanthin glucosyltransferase
MSADIPKWHFGVLSFTGAGHLAPLLALGQELKHRGHRVTFFEKPKIEERVRNAGLEFVALGERRTRKQAVVPPSSPGILWELSMLRFNLNRIIQDVQLFLDASPSTLGDAGVNALIVNEIAFTGPTVAQMLGLPYFIVSTNIPHRFGWGEYRRFGGYRLSRSALAPLERALLELSCLRMRGPIGRVVDRYRRHLGFGPVWKSQNEYPCLAHITQIPQFFDIPRNNLPEGFFYAGPFVSSSSKPKADFLWERLDGRPLVYASMGTTRNVQTEIFRLIAGVCRELDLQLVIALGNRFDAADFANLPGAPVVAQYAPQRELLEFASLVISHGGLNTALESIDAGKPMIVIPLAYDQPANALRLHRLGIAEVLPAMRLTGQRIHAAILKVMNEPRYRAAALQAQSKLRSLNGTSRAANIMEESLKEYVGTATLDSVKLASCLRRKRFESLEGAG